MKIKLETADLSLSTLVAIKVDLEKYAHLDLYDKVFSFLCREIYTRDKEIGESY